MEATILKTTTACADTSLRKISDIDFKLIKNGDGSSGIKLFIQLVGTTTLTLGATGSFYTSSSFATPTGTPNSQTITNSGTIYIKVSADTTLRMTNAGAITKIDGGDTSVSNVANAPWVTLSDFAQIASLASLNYIDIRLNTFVGDIKWFKNAINLQTLYLNDRKDYYGEIGALNNKITGDLSTLVGLTSLVYLGINGTEVTGGSGVFQNLPNLESINAGNTNIGTFDLKHILLSAKIQYVSLDNVTSGVVYTGTSTPVTGHPMRELYAQYCALDVNSLNNILAALAGASWSGNKTVWLKSDTVDGSGYPTNATTIANANALKAAMGVGAVVKISNKTY